MAAKPKPDVDVGLYRFRDFGAIQEAFGISADALAVLANEAGFPVFSRKISPALMMEWLKENSAKLRDLKVG